jgi:cellulose 1,4-beta-cellobiosidase
MFEDRPHLIAFRDCMVVVCLMLLVGCKGVDTYTNPSTGTPTDNGSTQIPAVPANLAAKSGNAQAGLTWSASSSATSYNVKRSTTSGGPYTQLAASAAPSYTDSTATNGTTYFYVVSAVDSAGESANSAQASAIPPSRARPCLRV